ncbi:MAG: hypothetical protein ACREYF_23095 [Gammaproteobacteria bacterium]
MSETESEIRIWAAPITLGLVTSAGLIVALLADGVGDAVSWAALAIPVAVCCWYALKKRTRLF